MTDDINITSSSSGIAIKRSDITLDGNGYTLAGLGLGGDGISLIDGWANHVTVQNMTVIGFWDGIHLGTSSNNTIRGNSFSNCGGSLVVLGWSSNGNTIDKNNITSGNYGVELFYYSSNNNFTRNYIANNRFWAITLHLGAGDCSFYHNIISGPVINDGPASAWDNGYPSGGNYWVGYISLDLYNGPYQNITGGDGIGDKAYLAAGILNVDHYPFMLVSICNVSQTPPMSDVLPTDVVRVNATVTHLYSLEGVILNCTFSNDSDTWTSSFSMTNLEDNVWNGTIPSFPAGTNVTYAIIAQDNEHNSISSEIQGYSFDYPIVSEYSIAIFVPLFVTATLLAVMAYRRKRQEKR